MKVKVKNKTTDQILNGNMEIGSGNRELFFVKQDRPTF